MSENKNKNQEPKDNPTPVIEDPDLRAIAVEFPDFAEIVAGADFGADDLKVEAPEPGLRYYWAAPDKGRADGVERVKQLGYRASEKKHNSPDLVLMETPQALYDLRKKRENEQIQRKMDAVKRRVSTSAAAGLEAMTTRGEKSRLQHKH